MHREHYGQQSDDPREPTAPHTRPPVELAGRSQIAAGVFAVLAFAAGWGASGLLVAILFAVAAVLLTVTIIVGADRQPWNTRKSVVVGATFAISIASILIAFSTMEDGAYSSLGPGADRSSSGDGATTSTRTPETSNRTSTSSLDGSTSASGVREVQWSGKVNLTFVDLDPVPPEVVSDNSRASVWISYSTDSYGNIEHATLYGMRGELFTSQPTIGLWEESSTPGPQQCADLVSTRGVEAAPVTEGMRVCALTPDGRVAFLSDVTLDEALGVYTATATIWGSWS